MPKIPLEVLAQQHIDGRMALRIVRFTELNPEQKLSYALEVLIDQQKGVLAVLEISTALAKEAVAWKATPEGAAWEKQKALKRTTHT